jgi:23S rRNA (uracil1939-C5)-methyltransferase
MREPLNAGELKGITGIVLDPPRAGASAQVKEIVAASNIGVVASVSCDPGTFARDARLLVDGGYALETVVPLDQFRYSAHVEMVGIFRR